MVRLQVKIEEWLPVKINGIDCKIFFHNTKSGTIECGVGWNGIEKLYKTEKALKAIAKNAKKKKRHL